MSRDLPHAVFSEEPGLPKWRRPVRGFKNSLSSPLKHEVDVSNETATAIASSSEFDATLSSSWHDFGNDSSESDCSASPSWSGIATEEESSSGEKFPAWISRIMLFKSSTGLRSGWRAYVLTEELSAAFPFVVTQQCSDVAWQAKC